jgi:hypothetical protein
MFFLAVLLLPASAFAQTSTQKSIRMIVPFAAGASADGIARAIAIDLGKRLGKTVVVENIVGAGGTTGLVALANAAPDGDTLGIGATGALVVQPHLPGPTAPDLLRRITPVAKLIEVGIVVVANPKVGPKSIAELIARSKENPQGISYGSTGVHTGQHLTMEMLARATGANLVHIPYRGSAPAIVDLVAGQIPVASVDHLGLSAYRRRPGGRARHGRDAAVQGGAGDPDHRRRRRDRLRPSRRHDRAVCANGHPAGPGEAPVRRSPRDPGHAGGPGQRQDADRVDGLSGRRRICSVAGLRIRALETDPAIA